ncbi:MAG: sulfate adenylyltransferase, partial [Thermodesulfobacteriota bacterium]|nr:sulfate adenylyltransferase [Thermodesulfobacteriota bacterium]
MARTKLVSPHGGGGLKPLMLKGDALKEEIKRAASLPKLNITSRESGDLLMMGCGAFTPLEGFMTHADWKGVCDGYKMANGLFWPIPITVSTDDEAVKVGDEIALIDSDSGDLMATMKVTEK